MIWPTLMLACACGGVTSMQASAHEIVITVLITGALMLWSACNDGL